MIIARVQRVCKNASVQQTRALQHKGRLEVEQLAFTRSVSRHAQLGPPWAVPDAQLFDDDEDPASRLLRRRVRWEVIDESRNARITGQEAFLSLSVLRLSSDSGIGARIPLTSIHREEYMQPIFGANYLTGLAMQDGATVRWTLEFLSAGAAQFASVFFRAVRAARSRHHEHRGDPGLRPRGERGRGRDPRLGRGRARRRRADGGPADGDGPVNRVARAERPAPCLARRSPRASARRHRRGISTAVRCPVLRRPP